MTVDSFYRLCGALPIALPVALIPVARMASGDGRVANFASSVASVLVMAGLYGGVFWVCIAGATLWRLRGQPLLAYRKAAALSPLFMAMSFVVIAVLLSGFDSTLELKDAIFLGGYFGGWSLGVGYFYVALTEIVLWCLIRARIVQVATSAA